MLDLTNRIFYCYAWEDLSEVQKVNTAICHELNVSITPFRGDESVEDIEDKVFPLVEKAELVLVFISDTAKSSEYAKQVALHAQHLNKKVIPVKVGTNSPFKSTPDEFKFRSDTYDYGKEDDRSKLFAQLKAHFAISVEGGDNYGTLIHVTTDVNVSILRYGKELIKAYVGKDNTLRLGKGTHTFLIVNLGATNERYEMSYVVNSNEGEQPLDIKFRAEMFKRQQEAKAKREKEASRNRTKARVKTIFSILASLIPFLAVVFTVVYFTVLKPQLKDKNADRYYVLPEGLYIRESKMSDVANKSASVFFGQELIVYEIDDEWAHVKLKKPGQSNKEATVGYVSSSYLINKHDFYLLRSIFGNEDSKKVAETSKCRKAFIDYFNMHGYIGRMTEEERQLAGITIQPNETNQWQLFTLDSKSKQNYAYFKKVMSQSQKYMDAFFLIKNIVTGDRKLIMFHYDDDETPHFMAEMDAPTTGYLKSVRISQSGSKITMYPEYTK